MKAHQMTKLLGGARSHHRGWVILKPILSLMDAPAPMEAQEKQDRRLERRSHLPFPAVNATLSGATECCGGLLLLVGFASRLAAVPLIFVMIVAYLTAEIEVVKNIFDDPDKFFAAGPFLFLLTSLIVLVFGPGAFSIDHFLTKRTVAAFTVSQAQHTPD